MKNIQIIKSDYYLQSSFLFFKKNLDKRINFLKKKNFLFSEISSFINNCINNSKKIYIFCAGNSAISKNINSEKIYIKEIHEDYKIKHNNNVEYKDDISEEIISDCDNILIADIEHQANPALNLLNLSKLVNDDARIIVLSKNLFWLLIIKILKFFLIFSPRKNNFLPSSYLHNLYSSCNLEIVRTERIIAIPIYVPFFTKLLNKIFRLPILNLLCVSNVTILKKIKVKKSNADNYKISFIIPCKNEEKNIPLFEKEISLLIDNYEFLFGDDQSTDKTIEEIKKLSLKLKEVNINKYDGPGICKSENVYQGIEQSKGDIIVIYDADLTVDFKDIKFAINILNTTNADFINCTRMIYPQNDGAMKILNFFGNSFFAYLFSILFKKKISDTLCGTKIFYKKDWFKIKKDLSSWGAKDLWGDFDLLIGAYKNNLKIIEVPVTYYERQKGITKMTSLFSNTIRMLWIVFASYYKLRLKE